MSLVCDFIIIASLHIITLSSFINEETGNGDWNVSSNRAKPFSLGLGRLSCWPVWIWWWRPRTHAEHSPGRQLEPCGFSPCLLTILSLLCAGRYCRAGDSAVTKNKQQDPCSQLHSRWFLPPFSKTCCLPGLVLATESVGVKHRKLRAHMEHVH